MKKLEKSVLKEEMKNLKTITERKERKNKKIVDINWILKITLLAFTLSIVFSFLCEIALPKVDIVVEILLIFLFIFLGVLFDMIGVAVTSADIEPFNSMSSRKVKGAKTAVKLIKKSDKVSSFCNDVIGDICGIISGSAGTIVSVSLSNTLSFSPLLTTLITTACIASLTIGGKALGKSYAVNKNNLILYKFAKLVAHFRKE
jgi:hypothetical protein